MAKPKATAARTQAFGPAARAAARALKHKRNYHRMLKKEGHKKGDASDATAAAVDGGTEKKHEVNADRPRKQTPTAAAGTHAANPFEKALNQQKKLKDEQERARKARPGPASWCGSPVAARLLTTVSSSGSRLAGSRRRRRR